MESAPPSEGLEASLLRRWFPQSAAGISTLQQHERFSETDLRDISDVLRRVGKGAWSRIPRVYAVLRLMDRLDAIDLFLAQSISDVYFPFSHQTLPQSLNPSVAQGFLQVQRVVLSSALDLERETGRHRHFASAADVPFIKVEDLGKGTYGFVDRVISTISHKEYARKLIPRGRTFRRDQRILRDFERELGALKKLRHHRHIVQLIGSYTDPRFVGIVMSPIAECDLKEFLNNCVSDGKANPHSPKSFTRSFFGCLTSALCYLHDSTIRHKDIKPQNVLVSQHTVYLTDFGISLDWSEVGQSTTTGPTPKTARYCAPEVSDYAPRNTSSDLWSLGCIFLEIWTVLKGETIANLHAFLEANGSMSSCYHVNSEATFAWIKRLELKATPADNPPIDWMRHLLVEEKGKRWTARQLLSEIESVNSNPEVKFAFSGQCCMEELESAESVVSSTGSLHESSVTGLVARQSPSTSTATIELAGEERLKAQFGPVPTSSSSPLKTAASSRSSNVTSNSKTIKPLSDRTPMTEDSIKGPSSSSELALEGTPNSEEGVPLDVPELREFAQWMQKRIDDSGRPQSSHPEITPASQHHAETRLPSLASLETGEPPSSSSDVLETSAADMIAELAFDLAARNEKRSSGQFDVESNMRADERGEQISDHAPHASEKTATNTTDEESMLSHDHMSYRPEGDSISTAPEYPVQPTKDSSHKSPNSSYVASPSAQYEWNTPERGNSNSIFGIQKLSRCSQAAASSSHGIPAHAHVMQPDESTLELDTQARDDLSVSSGEQDISTIEDSIAPTHGPSKADATRPAEDREEVTLQPLEKSEEVEYGTSKPSTSTGPTEIGDVLPSRPTAPFIGSSRNQGWPADVPRNDTLLDAHRQTPASKSDEDSAHLQSTPLEDLPSRVLQMRRLR
ncbi:kinase-like protein [Trematosphaeria pertusa]|uniref:Kinase-like protein n=1 Tax=Trematosphaeria pertusa TaxID=390896 RepID=A0A6A6IGR2_9PLEO|nr:kinase-like protein [Trematosphaeria pertusa]KAF2249611.1 kinase-like protein [Trematosphaeria pertusa]